MRIAEFALERFFARWEFAVKHLLCASDVEAWTMADVLALADDQTRALWDGLKLNYTESPGHPLLRAEIASLYESVEPDGVLVFAGAEEAIYCLSNVLLGPGDHAIVTWPGYQSLWEVGRAAGASMSLHALREGDGWALDVERIRRSLHPNTKLVVVNAPHNPTGMLPTSDEWRALMDLCAEAEVHLLADEVYRYLEFDAAARLPTGADQLERGVSLGVMSKSFAMPGLRIGWLATRDHDLLARCAAFKDYTSICSSAPSEVLALIGLRARERVLARSHDIVEANLPILDAFFDGSPETFSWVRPRGGSIAFPRLLSGTTTIDRFAADLIESEGVLIAPGSIFGMADGHFRLGFGRTDLPEALAGLERFAAARLR